MKVQRLPQCTRWLDHGITLIDTAQSYRTSEAIIGKALKDGRRAQVFLATKVSRDYSPDAIRGAMENSLRALQTDHVDLYQIHGWNPQYPVDDSMEMMERLRQEGKTRYIGVSNFNVEQMELAAQTAAFHSLQPRYSLLDREIEAKVLPYCETHGVGILPYSPLAKGLLTGKYTPDHQFPADDERCRDGSISRRGVSAELGDGGKTASHRSRTESHAHSISNRLAVTASGDYVCPRWCKNA